QPHVDRAREGHELVARVVDVVLRLDRVALGAEDARERVADRGGTRVHDDERPGGIGGHELEQHARALARVAPSVLLARGEDLVQGLRAPRGREEHVEEAGPRDLDAIHHRRLRERGDDGLRDLAGRATRLPRQAHGDVGGVVAVARFARDLPLHLGGCGQPGGVERVPQCVRERVRDVQRHRRRRFGGDSWMIPPAPRTSEEYSGAYGPVSARITRASRHAARVSASRSYEASRRARWSGPVTGSAGGAPRAQSSTRRRLAPVSKRPWRYVPHTRPSAETQPSPRPSISKRGVGAPSATVSPTWIS